MTNVKDVFAHSLILEVAKDLKEDKNVKMPEFAAFVKTGSHREREPANPDWWFIRMASILRKVYISGNVTVSSLRSYYGGKKRRGVRPAVFRKAGGKIIRVCLQDLGKLGFIEISTDKKGRVLTSKGQKYLDVMASKVYLDAQKKAKEETKNVEVKKEPKKVEKPKVTVKEDKTEKTEKLVEKTSVKENPKNTEEPKN